MAFPFPFCNNVTHSTIACNSAYKWSLDHWSLLGIVFNIFFGVLFFKLTTSSEYWCQLFIFWSTIKNICCAITCLCAECWLHLIGLVCILLFRRFVEAVQLKEFLRYSSDLEIPISKLVKQVYIRIYNSLSLDQI